MALGEAMARLKSPTAIQRVFAVADEPTRQNMRSWTAQTLMAKSLNRDGAVDGLRLQNNLLGKGELGRPVAEALYGQERLTAMERFASALKLTQQRPAEGTGRMFIQLTQAGAIMNLMGILGAPSGSAAIIVFGPLALAHLMTNPTTANLLTKGLTLPTKSPQVVAGMLRVLLTALPPRERGAIERQVAMTMAPPDRLVATRRGLRPSDVLLSQSLFRSPDIPSVAEDAKQAARLH